MVHAGNRMRAGPSSASNDAGVDLDFDDGDVLAPPPADDSITAAPGAGAPSASSAGCDSADADLLLPLPLPGDGMKPTAPTTSSVLMHAACSLDSCSVSTGMDW